MTDHYAKEAYLHLANQSVKQAEHLEKELAKEELYLASIIRQAVEAGASVSEVAANTHQSEDAIRRRLGGEGI